MNFESVAIALEGALKSFWSTTPIAWENSPFPVDDYFIRPRVLPTNSGKMGIGWQETVEISGIFSIDVIGPLQVGSGTIGGYADTLNSYFSDSVFGIVHTRTGLIGPGREVEGRYMKNIQIPFNSQQSA